MPRTDQTCFLDMIDEFVSSLNLTFTDQSVLVHKSYLHGSVATNERLGQLGCRVLFLYVKESVYIHNKNRTDLSSMMVRYIGKDELAAKGRKINLNRVVRWEDSSVGALP